MSAKYAQKTLNRKKYSLLQVLKSYGDGFAPVVNAIERTVKQNTRNFKVEKTVDGDLIPNKGEVLELNKFANEEGKDRLALIIECLWRTEVRGSLSKPSPTSWVTL